MSSVEEKDIISQNDLDEPWLLNYNMPGGWFDFPIPSPSWNFNMTNGFPFIHTPPPKSILQGITGLYNYKVPTDLQFAECSKVNGLSLWDHNGWWQCLFPQEIIRKRLNKIYHDIEKVDLNKFVSKESVSNDSARLSEYFNDYTKYLLWKSEQNKSSLSSCSSSSLLLDSNKKREDRQSWLPIDKVTTPEDIMQTGWIDDDSNEERRKKVIGRSQYMTYSSNNSTFGNSDASDNLTKEVTTIKTFYDDGSCAIKEREKITPNDGREPIIKEREKIIKEKPSSSSSSWF